MGDTGALSVGAGLGMVAVMTKMEVLLPFFAAMFLIEFGSSLLQIAGFKLTKRRILPIAPLHHVFEKWGWPEPKIVARFYIAGAIFALLGLSLLKL
jgi:phospho-N-acetylmuramoyl-pentapeptide-transferase